MLRVCNWHGSSSTTDGDRCDAASSHQPPLPITPADRPPTAATIALGPGEAKARRSGRACGWAFDNTKESPTLWPFFLSLSFRSPSHRGRGMGSFLFYFSVKGPPFLFLFFEFFFRVFIWKVGNLNWGVCVVASCGRGWRRWEDKGRSIALSRKKKNKKKSISSSSRNKEHTKHFFAGLPLLPLCNIFSMPCPFLLVCVTYSNLKNTKIKRKAPLYVLKKIPFPCLHLFLFQVANE